MANATDVVYNQGFHVHDFVLAISRCYAHHSVQRANEVAVRDTLRFMARQAGRVARLFGRAAAHSPVADVGGAAVGRVGVGASGKPQATKPLMASKRFFYLTSFMSAWRGWVVRPDAGAADESTARNRRGATRPLDRAAILPRGVRNVMSHDLVPTLSDYSVAAFVAAGHGVVDIEQLMGVRIDDHNSSESGSGDNLHFCSQVCAHTLMTRSYPWFS